MGAHSNFKLHRKDYRQIRTPSPPPFDLTGCTLRHPASISLKCVQYDEQYQLEAVALAEKDQRKQKMAEGTDEEGSDE